MKRIKLGFGFYIIRTPKSDKTFVSKRASKFMDEYFGEHQYTNPELSMTNRRFGFEDGYLACLKDLGIALRYSNKKNKP